MALAARLSWVQAQVAQLGSELDAVWAESASLETVWSPAVSGPEDALSAVEVEVEGVSGQRGRPHRPTTGSGAFEPSTPPLLK